MDDAAIARLVDGLADHGWAGIPALADRDEVRAIRSAAEDSFARGEFEAARIGIEGAPKRHGEVRGDSIRWIDDGQPPDALRPYFAFLDGLRLALNRGLYLGVDEYEGHFARFPPGAGYQRHLDSVPGRGRRLVSCVLYLNEQWTPGDGGELAVYDAEDEQREIARVEPTAGAFAAFLSESLPHAVLPAAAERWTLTGWLCKRRVVG